MRPNICFNNASCFFITIWFFCGIIIIIISYRTFIFLLKITGRVSKTLLILTSSVINVSSVDLRPYLHLCAHNNSQLSINISHRRCEAPASVGGCTAPQGCLRGLQFIIGLTVRLLPPPRAHIVCKWSENARGNALNSSYF